MQNKHIRVCGIDPGFDRLGIAIVEIRETKETLLFSDCIEPTKKATFEDRLREAGVKVRALLKEYKPHMVAIEKIFFSKNQKTAIAVAEVRGALRLICGECGLPVLELSPQEIKQAVTGYGNASKDQVERMVRLIVDIPKGKKRDDEFDAIAAALTGVGQVRYNLSTQRPSLD